MNDVNRLAWVHGLTVGAAKCSAVTQLQESKAAFVKLTLS